MVIDDCCFTNCAHLIYAALVTGHASPVNLRRKLTKKVCMGTDGLIGRYRIKYIYTSNMPLGNFVTTMRTKQ
jgi:hypothetical protein